MELETGGLPKTIEGATIRYLTHYEDNYVGSAADMFRLRNLARDFIHKLSKIAPRFYEEKLPQLVNQAASTLLTFDTTNKEELKKFHETHAYFLLILQDLKESRPEGEINFQVAKRRHAERAQLIKRQTELAEAIDSLEAEEFDFDEIGDEDIETRSEKVFTKLEALKKEQHDVNMRLAQIEGEKIEEEPDFKLRVKPNSILNRLTEEQLKYLEKQMLDFYKKNHQKKTAIYLDISIIDGMIEKLNINKSKFQLIELAQLSKDALDSYKSFYREKDQVARDEFHQDLLNNQRLRPKDGIILDDPDCLPEDIRRRLDENLKKCQEETDNLLDEFSSKQDELAESSGEEL